MNETDKKEFAAIVYPLGLLYEMDMSNKHVLKIWFEALSSYSVQEVAAGVTAYVKCPDHGSYKPKPADIIKMIDGTAADLAFLAWTKLVDALGRVGTYRTVVFDDPVIHRVVDDMGGWTSFGSKTERELPFAEKEFVGRYRALRVKGSVPRHASRLIGQTEANNAISGWGREEPPVLIGCQEKAMRVLTGFANKQLGAA